MKRIARFSMVVLLAATWLGAPSCAISRKSHQNARDHESDAAHCKMCKMAQCCGPCDKEKTCDHCSNEQCMKMMRGEKK